MAGNESRVGRSEEDPDVGGAERSPGRAAGPARIRVLPAQLADQIAAGEVVERPASVVKELVDNAIDAGARRVDIELDGGGVERIQVVDDGVGMDAEDLDLAVLRHATSKLASADELVEPRTLGFRGEALASIAAVASVEIASRPVGASMGTRLRVRPGIAPERDRCGMAPGTRVDVRGLFANVPARRKFLRTSATEVAHCSEVVQRLALVHPEVALRLRHEGRTIVDLPRTSADERVVEVLARRGATVEQVIDGVWDGVAIRIFLGGAARDRGDVLVVVRRRVVRERAIAQIVREEHRRRHGNGDPVACVFVEPPMGTVDVNVHPMKAEVRFSEAQGVYAAVRRALAQIGHAHARAHADVHAHAHAHAADRERGGERERSGERERERDSSPELPGMTLPAAAQEASVGYRLETRAVSADYGRHREDLRDAARSLADARASVAARVDGPDRPRDDDADEVVVPASVDPPPLEPELLAVLPGPVALARLGDDVLAVDLRALRTHLVQRRLARELGEGGVVAQALLVPAVVPLAPADAQACARAADVLAELGVVVEGFGEDAVIVRAVPAALRGCVDDLQVGELVARLLPWVRLRVRARDDDEPEARAAVLARAVDAGPSGGATSTRLARSFLRELVASGESLDDVPGVRRWRARELVGLRE